MALTCIVGIRSQSKPLDIMHEVFKAMKSLDYVSFYTTINFTRLSVTEVGVLPAAAWGWYGRARHALRCEVGLAGLAWSLHGKQT